MSTPNQTSRFILSIVGVFVILLIAVITFIGYQFLSKEKISGKVLIVQRDANVKKLALIKIYAVRVADVISWKRNLNERLRLAVESIHRFQKESAVAEAEIKEIGEKRVANSNECITRTEEVTEIARKIWLIDRNSQVLRKRFNQLIMSEGILRGN